MTGVIIAALVCAAAVAVFVGLMRLSARLSVVEWHGPGDHPRHAPKFSGGAR